MATIEKTTMHTTEPSFLEITEEALNLIAGLVSGLMPLFLLSMPILAPLAVVGGIVMTALALVLGLVAALLAVPLLAVRTIVRHRRMA